jgi:O-antigen/teichoic acid export membrane protein
MRDGGLSSRARRLLPAGLLDAGLASLASFVVGVYAARFLPASELGAYALFFTAFLLAAVVPTQLILAPAEIAAVEAARVERVGLFRQSWRLAGPSAVIAACLASLAACLGANAPAGSLVALAVTTAACSVVSPVQDHVRRTLHLAGFSWRAALVSLVQLLAAVAGLAVFHAAGVPEIWRPFGALALANAISFSVGVILARREVRASSLQRYQAKALTGSGRWLLVLELATAAATFLSSVLITRLASAEALGHAEAARIVAQPMFVLLVGLSAVLGPRSMEAAAARDYKVARNIARPFNALLVTAGLAYSAMTVLPWWGNPFGALVPKAYAVPGLVLASVLGYVVVGIVFPYRSELLGAHQERLLPPVAMLAGAAQLVVTAGAAWVGAFARPLGGGIFGLVLWAGYRRHRQAMYRNEGSPGRVHQPADRYP